ncbi:uncharacterized protein LAJ45_01706 [Morchella importuna]|uniref:Ribophorin II C-terminal domain-containing protein n=1 Tax=Morchella conica CCBAS932 TaxID=1392247 RepID=A0A3N4KSV4_9PEZI|nr:uncharacterized protein LAJ45_01706 [Morchella importuna]KAH8153939.1 hypothetical protein LAJ45_01706 [Morchella importuna]RPB13596.1 hypothetical protein P167DRAFT_564452 [Morchella conica CCBAS932]
MRSIISADMSLKTFFVLSLSTLAAATGTWTFEDGKATISGKGVAEGSRSFSATKPIVESLTLAPRETLKLTFSLKEDSKAARPHQAFLLVSEEASGLETFYPLTIKGESGKAKVELTHKDLPAHLLASPKLSLSIALGSFGSTPGSILPIGNLIPALDAAALGLLEKQKLKDLGEGAIVYKAKKEISHIFRADPQNPPKIITLVFLASVIASLVGLFVVWFPILGANFSHLPKALGAAPVSHPLFFASLVTLEGIFFLYYTQWNLFQTLGASLIVAPIALFSGSRALREVRARRERGQR